MPNFWDPIVLEDYEIIHHIQVPQSEANNGDPYVTLIPNRRYYFLCRTNGPSRALEIAEEYMWRKVYHEDGLTYGYDPISSLSIVPMNFTSSSYEDKFGVLWKILVDIVPYTAMMNDPESSEYYVFNAGAYSRDSLTDIHSVPLLLQYKYPSDHPSRPDEIINANGVIQKDVALFTFNLNLIKEMKYPEAAAGFISYVNKLAWKGFPPRTVKITNISIRPKTINTSRSDVSKKVYICTFEFQVNDIGWDQTVAITDPLTGQYPGDVSFDGTVQTGCTYPPGKKVEVLPEFDFHRIFPDSDNTTFQDRGAIEFPLPGT